MALADIKFQSAILLETPQTTIFHAEVKRKLQG